MSNTKLFSVLLLNNLFLILLAVLAFYFYKAYQKNTIAYTPPVTILPTPNLLPTTTPAIIAAISTPTASIKIATICDTNLNLQATDSASISSADFMYFTQKAVIQNNKDISTLYCSQNDTTIDTQTLRTSVEQELDFNKIHTQKPTYKLTPKNLFVLFSDSLNIDKLIN